MEGTDPQHMDMRNSKRIKWKYKFQTNNIPENNTTRNQALTSFTCYIPRIRSFLEIKQPAQQDLMIDQADQCKSIVVELSSKKSGLLESLLVAARTTTKKSSN